MTLTVRAVLTLTAAAVCLSACTAPAPTLPLPVPAGHPSATAACTALTRWDVNHGTTGLTTALTAANTAATANQRYLTLNVHVGDFARDYTTAIGDAHARIPSGQATLAAARAEYGFAVHECTVLGVPMPVTPGGFADTSR